MKGMYVASAEKRNRVMRSGMSDPLRIFGAMWFALTARTAPTQTPLTGTKKPFRPTKTSMEPLMPQETPSNH